MSEHDPRDDYDDEPARGPLAPTHVVELPGTVMWLYCLFHFLLAQLWFVYVSFEFVEKHFVRDNKDFEGALNSFKKDQTLYLSLAAWPLATILTMYVRRAAFNLLGFRCYRQVVIAAFIICFGIPFVLLAPISLLLSGYVFGLLLRRDVRARFEAVARGTITSPSSEVTDARSDRSA